MLHLHWMLWQSVKCLLLQLECLLVHVLAYLVVLVKYQGMDRFVFHICVSKWLHQNVVVSITLILGYQCFIINIPAAVHGEILEHRGVHYFQQNYFTLRQQ